VKHVRVPFNRPYVAGREMGYIREALHSGHRHGDGAFTQQCHSWLEKTLGCPKALLTPSGTAALEMAAILADIMPGDEVIMPSFTFSSTANAFVLRGGTPVFVDIDPRTQNIDASKIEEAMSDRTRAVVPVHYAGVGCDMDVIMSIAQRYKLLVIEDAAQALLARYRGRYLGTIGHLGTLSFHDSKNCSAGEAGALLINDPRFIERAEVVREKGTSRPQFVRGEVDKYTWIDVGSSYLPSEVTAAFLLAQLEEADATKTKRVAAWNVYEERLGEVSPGLARRPYVPPECEHNGHLFYLVLAGEAIRRSFIAGMEQRGIVTLFHYVPLHNSVAGLRYGRPGGVLTATEVAGRGLVRLPLWRDMPFSLLELVITETGAVLSSLG